MASKIEKGALPSIKYPGCGPTASGSTLVPRNYPQEDHLQRHVSFRQTFPVPIVEIPKIEMDILLEPAVNGDHHKLRQGQKVSELEDGEEEQEEQDSNESDDEDPDDEGSNDEHPDNGSSEYEEVSDT